MTGHGGAWQLPLTPHVLPINRNIQIYGPLHTIPGAQTRVTTTISTVGPLFASGALIEARYMDTFPRPYLPRGG